MDIKTDIYLNQLAQRVNTLAEGKNWFQRLGTDLQLLVLQRLVFFISQSGAVGNDVDAAITQSKLKRSYTPCQLLLKAMLEEPKGSGRLRYYLSKVLQLPNNERLKIFVLLVSLFSVSAIRKKKECFDPEQYWWHRDLANDLEVKKIVDKLG